MHLSLTGVLPFLGHDHPTAAAFLTCRHHNFHASIIPEFLSDEERVKSFCEARQQNQLKADNEKQYKNLFNLFVQTPLMQFSPSLMVWHEDCAASILKPLLETKYFTRTLQRCTVECDDLSNDLFQALSKIRSLTNLDLGLSKVENEHMEIIINSFPSLEMLTIENAGQLKIVDPSEPAIEVLSPPPPATKTLRSLTLRPVDPLFAIQFIPIFTNLRKLELSAQNESQELDLLPLSTSLPLLIDMSLIYFDLKNLDSLNNLVHLSSLDFTWCPMTDLSFLTQENSIPELTTLSIDECYGLSTSSLASLSHAPNLQVLDLSNCDNFNNDCLQYLENMIHLRKLDLSYTKIVGDSRSLKTLMQNLFQLEELNLSGCQHIGNKGVIGGALYSTHSKLRVLNLNRCELVDDDLNGIGALKNTLEALGLWFNPDLTNATLVHCGDLVKLKVLSLKYCHAINDLSPLKDCLNLEELNVSSCSELTDDSFKVFSEEPNSFPNLRVLKHAFCELTEEVFEYLSKNNNLVYRLNELDVGGMSGILSSSETARNHIYELKGLSKLSGVPCSLSESDRNKLKRELMRSLKNLEKILEYDDESDYIE